MLLLDWCAHLGDHEDFQQPGIQQKREALSIFREIWSEANSPLRRMYSSWEELERNVDVKSDRTTGRKTKFYPCPYCGARQSIVKPLNGIFPYQKCESCERPFYIKSDLTVRKLSKEEVAEIPGGWIQIVEDFAKRRVAVVFGLE